MIIEYSNKKTEKLCEEEKVAIKTLGKEVAFKLSLLMDVMKASKCLNDLRCLPQFRLHALQGNRKYQYSLTIDKRYKWRLILYPLDENGNILKNYSNESEKLIKTVKAQILEVSEHYDL